MRRESSRQRVRRVAIALGALVVILVIIWVDVATGLWQDLVIVAGLAAGLVSFLLTILVLNRIVERAAARRWAPVNRLALSEFLHVIADDEHSEISRGLIVPRTLAAPAPESAGSQLIAELEQLRETVVRERRALSDALSRWSQFLASSGDNETVLLHIADIAWRFDRVRDAALEVEEYPGDVRRRETLHCEIDGCNAATLALEGELSARISLAPGDPVTETSEPLAMSAARAGRPDTGAR